MTARKTPPKKPVKPRVKPAPKPEPRIDPNLDVKQVPMADIIKTVVQGGCYQVKDGVAVKQEK